MSAELVAQFLGVTTVALAGLILSATTDNRALHKRVQAQRRMIADLSARVLTLQEENNRLRTANGETPEDPASKHADLTPCNWPRPEA